MRPRAWDESIGTGIPKIDDEHRVQVSLVNALAEVLRAGKGRALAEKTLQQLSDFTAAHFGSEELLMDLHRYPQREAHAREHGRLTEQLVKIRESALADDPARALQHVDDLRTWLTAHIRSMDQGFALWCDRKGIEPEPTGD